MTNGENTRNSKVGKLNQKGDREGKRRIVNYLKSGRMS